MSKPPSKIRAIVCGLDQLDCYSSTGITHVLSILDPECPDPQVFKTYQPHCRTILRFHDDIEPGPNIILPTIDHIERILSLGHSMSDLEKDGKLHVLVHCQMGISRSTAATAILLALARQTRDENNIFAELLELQPNAWPNSLMIELADRLLGRHGNFAAALGRLYAIQLAKRPEMGSYMREHGRGREVDMATQHGSFTS